MTAPLGEGGFAAWLRDGAGRPDAVALESGERAFTYAQLWDSAERAAAALTQRGRGEGPVAIVGANAPEYVFAMLGALSLGRPVAEVNHHESPQRLARLLRALDPSAIVADRGHDALLAAGAPVLRYEDIAQAAADTAAGRARARSVDSGDVAFVVFTSGTTGDPKGVMLTHANVAAVTEAILEYLPLDPSDRYALVLPLFHTYAKSVLATTLRAGGTLVLEDGFQDLPGFVASLERRGITAWSGVPYHVNMLLRRAPLDRHDLSRLRFVTVSGSHLSPAAIGEWRRRLPRARLYFMYGLTESSTRACALPPERIDEKAGSCGRPIQGVSLRIVDEDGRDVPTGVVGEVLLAGPNIMKGYWGEPALTKETLSDGWLRTGDLGRVDDEGFLYLEGRKRDLIKCAGERISAREIEDALAAHPALVEVAVVGAPHEILGEIAAAYVVRKDDAIDEAALRAWCAERLTHHKIPRSFTFVETLPKTASGKIQKHRLSQM